MMLLRQKMHSLFPQDFSLIDKYTSIGLGYLLLCCVGLFFDAYWLFALPIVPFVVWFFFKRLDLFYCGLVFLIPLSITIDDIGLGFGIILPTEPILFSLTCLIGLKFFMHPKILLESFQSPITKGILFYLAWMFITVLTSSMPVVSLKFFILKLSYILCFYFLSYLFFYKQPFKQIKKLYYLFFIPLLAVITYTLYRHTLYAYDEKAAHWVMQPFFKDHTVYGAILAFMAPFLVYMATRKKQTFNRLVFSAFSTIVFSMGLIFSYTRAAWVSLAGALGLYLILYFKVSWKFLVIVALFLGGYLFVNQEQILLKLQKNKQDSSDDLVEHVQSISNIASDASNLERVNRWNCAIEMFKERPVFGFGPGTYMFQYARFQKSDDLTIISTNFADGGNAHSEYLGPLSESGVFGFLSVFVFILLMCVYAIKALYTFYGDDKKVIFFVFLGFTTYAAHGILNNYLDTDKAAFLFFSALAFIAVINQKGLALNGDSNTIQKANTH